MQTDQRKAHTRTSCQSDGVHILLSAALFLLITCSEASLYMFLGMGSGLHILDSLSGVSWHRSALVYRSLPIIGLACKGIFQARPLHLDPCCCLGAACKLAKASPASAKLGRSWKLLDFISCLRCLFAAAASCAIARCTLRLCSTEACTLLVLWQYSQIA